MPGNGISRLESNVTREESMRRRVIVASAVFLAGVMMEPATAGENNGSPAPPPQQGEGKEMSPGANRDVTVSETRKNLFNRQEEARQRRDAMLKVRAETIRAAEQGESGEQQPSR
jgi:hypothetical protein